MFCRSWTSKIGWLVVELGGVTLNEGRIMFVQSSWQKITVLW